MRSSIGSSSSLPKTGSKTPSFMTAPGPGGARRWRPRAYRPSSRRPGQGDEPTAPGDAAPGMTGQRRGQPTLREKLVGDHRRRANGSGLAAERRRKNKEVARGEGQRPAIDRLANGCEQLVSGVGHPASDHDQRWIEEVDDARQHRADEMPRSVQELLARDVAVGGRLCDVRGGQGSTWTPQTREIPAAPRSGHGLRLAGERVPARQRLQTADVSAATDDVWIVADRDVADVAGRAARTAMEISVSDHARTDARPDLHEHGVSVIARD